MLAWRAFTRGYFENAPGSWHETHSSLGNQLTISVPSSNFEGNRRKGSTGGIGKSGWSETGIGTIKSVSIAKRLSIEQRNIDLCKKQSSGKPYL